MTWVPRCHCAEVPKVIIYLGTTSEGSINRTCLTSAQTHTGAVGQSLSSAYARPKGSSLPPLRSGGPLLRAPRSGSGEGPQAAPDFIESVLVIDVSLLMCHY